jgi:hypothetical protein
MAAARPGNVRPPSRSIALPPAGVDPQRVEVVLAPRHFPGLAIDPFRRRPGPDGDRILRGAPAERIADGVFGGGDLDEVDGPAHAVDLGDDRLGGLPQVTGGEVPAEPSASRADVAGDAP